MLEQIKRSGGKELRELERGMRIRRGVGGGVQKESGKISNIPARQIACRELAGEKIFRQSGKRRTFWRQVSPKFGYGEPKQICLANVIRVCERSNRRTTNALYNICLSV